MGNKPKEQIEAEKAESREKKELDLEMCGQLQFMPSEAALMLEFGEMKTIDLQNQCRKKAGALFEEYERGRLKGIAIVRLAAQAMARSGSTPAQSIFNEYIEATAKKLERNEI